MSDLKEYIEEVKLLIRELKKKEIKDRMDAHASLSEILVQLQSSILGWAKWIQDPRIMSRFSEEELKTFFEEMRKISIEFLELDIKATNKMLKKGKKKSKKKTKERKYIA